MAAIILSQEIAKLFNLSAGRVNNIMLEINEKLHVASKKERSQHVLRGDTT